MGVEVFDLIDEPDAKEDISSFDVTVEHPLLLLTRRISFSLLFKARAKMAPK